MCICSGAEQSSLIGRCRDDDNAAFERRIDHIGTPNPGHLHAHALWEDDWDVRYSPEPDEDDSDAEGPRYVFCSNEG
jgi:hypothetical protein